MSLSIAVPTVGQPFSSQAPTVDSNFTNLSAWANGNIPGSDLSPSANIAGSQLAAAAAIADTQLASPNNSVPRRLLVSACGITGGGTSANYLFPVSSGPVTTGSPVSAPLDLYMGDQAASLAVAGKTTVGRVRAKVVVNTIAPAVTLTFGLYLLTSVAGTGSNIIYNFGSAVVGTTAALVTPSAASGNFVQSSQFTLPTTVGNVYALGVFLSGTTAANSGVYGSVELVGYNA